MLRLAAILCLASGLCAQQPDPALAPITDDPKLPRVLIIGDSISMGYTARVRELLAGQYNVHRIPENAGSSGNGVEKIGAWIGGGNWRVIYFNFGLHDVKYMSDQKRQVSLEDYERNLRAIAKRLIVSGARVIFAATTPVPGETENPPRKEEDVQRYNEVALRVMSRIGVMVDDLYSFALPQLDKIQQPHDVHFTEEGYRALAERVAASIRAAATAQ